MDMLKDMILRLMQRIYRFFTGKQIDTGEGLENDCGQEDDRNQ